MTAEQSALDPRRQRRRIPVILLGAVPLALAATILVTGPTATAPAYSADALPAVAQPAQVLTTTPIVLSATEAAGAQTAQIAAPSALRLPSVTYKTFCADPTNPVSTTSTTGRALLTMVNKERAKIGIRSLTWSTSLADTAGAWSRTMLARDLKTSTLIDGLAHNPNRPGAENVAVVYRSTGYTASSAITKMHKNLVYSSGHCLNLMNPNYKYMGSGLARSSNNRTWYATENFR